MSVRALLLLLALLPATARSDASSFPRSRFSIAGKAAHREAFAGLFAGGMQRHVLPLRESDKIARIVVPRIAVDVMNMISSCQAAPVCLFPDEAVLWDISATGSQVMPGPIDEPISLRVPLAAPFPTEGTLPARVVSMDVPEWIAGILLPFGIRILGDRSSLSTAALTEAGWREANRWRNTGRGPQPFPFCSALIVSRQESRLPVLVMRKLRDSMAATALATRHRAPTGGGLFLL